MPTRSEVANALLVTLFRHNGVVKEFGAGEEIVDEIANDFSLNAGQKTAYLETLYRKEDRVKKSSLWHRLLFRAADILAKEKLVSRPTQTLQLTNKREWMLTENGLDQALRLLEIPLEKKELLQTRSYEVQKIVKRIKETPRPENYIPFDKTKTAVFVTLQKTLRTRGFRQAVIEAYNCACAVCGLKINSPDSLLWEVEAAHIVPHSSKGRDDIWNGLALCRHHHWAFDVGWFTLSDDYKIHISTQADTLPQNFGISRDYEFVKSIGQERRKINLPQNKEIYPHKNSLQWHRENVFYDYKKEKGK